MRPVVVAHGLWMPGFETMLLRQRLRSAGYDPLLFRFPTVAATLTENVQRFLRFTEAIPGGELDYVGYSLGGVVALAALADAGRDARSGRVVCLGSPLNGSRSARRLSMSGLGRRIVGRSMAELEARGGVGSWCGPHELGVIAGNVSFGIGRLFGGFGEPNDGTVTVTETRIGGMDDHIVLPVTHTTLLLDADVARQTIAFLTRGRFDRAH